MVMNLVLYAILILMALALWAGCGSFWTKWMENNTGVPLSNINIVIVHIVSPVLTLVSVVYSIPYKILNWALDLKKEI